jgi:uncharacterized protein (TIGR00369 family)
MTDTAVSQEQRAYWDALERQYEASPIHGALGLTLRVRGGGDVVVEYDGGRAGRNRGGNVAGGSLAAMIDSAVCQAWRTLLPAEARLATIELKVNYLKAAREPEGVLTTAELQHVGRRTAVGLARAYQGDTCVAIGLVTATRVE